MDPKLYTDEFRNFKFLKSSREQVLYYKETAANLNRIRPSNEVANPDFVWPCRVEFLEQLLDLQDDSVYIVFPGILNTRNDFESANVVTIENPVILSGNPMVQNCRTVSDIRILEDNKHRLFLCELNGAGNNYRHVYSLKTLPVVPLQQTDSFIALFYDEEWAKKYSVALTKHLRYLNDAVSSFTRLI